MIKAYKRFWKGYVDFKGRSTPSDYWFAYSAHVLIFFTWYLLLAVFERMAAETGSSDLFTIGVILFLIIFVFCIAAVLPGIAITVRRLRDAGYNWPYIFIPLIPFVGIFILIFLLCQPTEVEVPLNNVDNPQQ
ncbi:MAG: DUF805 domain-containing protein [Streptococcus salivarius]|uniref:DUF805 domain-containing protein n=1 Tax=Streptococcus salivarius TaxID=1304 RepID=UPI001D22980A|nr:DUF805 domain-containing protein [Streptococcus salivarius]